MTPLAHAGHWLAQLLYLAPVVAMLAAIVYAKIRARGHDDVSSSGLRGNDSDDVQS